MDLSANICGFCCRVHTKNNLTQLEGSQDEFVHIFMWQEEEEGVDNLVICNSCNIKLDDFKQFWEQCRMNIKMMKKIKSEHEKQNNLEEPDSTWTSKLEQKYRKDLNEQKVNDSEIYTNKKSHNVPTNSITIAETDETESEIDKHAEMIKEANRIRNIRYNKGEKNQKDSEVIKMPDAPLNRITIQETSILPESSMFEANHTDITPDVSIVMEAENTSENEDNLEILEEPVSPPPSLDMMSSCSIFNPSGVPILIPCVTSLSYRKFKTIPDPESRSLLPVRSFDSDARRKQRNREASRRYRERAREDPELLKKMREQQNARQKKYYARLRMKKQSSGEWDTAGEEEQGRG
eukprot:GFUD01000073.1.p1 GENE.GFUD01000073.1~~GFUD01000073.1.p1  ORF type:complete len:350 (+),score=106.34 GFUD01000073.1:38-1087(+)